MRCNATVFIACCSAKIVKVLGNYHIIPKFSSLATILHILQLRQHAQAISYQVITEGGPKSGLSFSDLVLGQLMAPHSVVNKVPKGFWIDIIFHIENLIPNCPECSECSECPE